jgi:hypothetical protein
MGGGTVGIKFLLSEKRMETGNPSQRYAQEMTITLGLRMEIRPLVIGGVVLEKETFGYVTASKAYLQSQTQKAKPSLTFLPMRAICNDIAKKGIIPP